MPEVIGTPRPNQAAGVDRRVVMGLLVGAGPIPDMERQQRRPKKYAGKECYCREQPGLGCCGGGVTIHGSAWDRPTLPALGIGWVAQVL